MDINKANKLSAQVLDSIISGDFIDDYNLILICDDLKLTDEEIELITGLDLEDIKFCREENK
ncbi:hypothetical protein [uncultured phage_MedDCM-OCT-S28-C10]|uniref:Uncharacterized protein n=1 Tax=uncultured phage_MedDCM-OCT-S28-C10 TaxID=2741077 RepID=A0A6S4P9N7_9CAUD|nr:hypothetical protein HOQ60_gp29 [uncultured phage_MedDCM-OCT-S28-C10]BAQ94072.1 hypothetical protein [uncultured phage_MedDCM-OCT-S28-C10]BAR25274.1 hypothetical protein [uncultured Mediterranean phage uvMED]BAR25315.1 hypothetical protein [uncultured Mediterranean phage uvMED]